MVILPGAFLGICGWCVSQASKINQDNISIKAEQMLTISSLNRIESGITILYTKQEILNTQLATMNTAQALTNQSIVDHIKLDSTRSNSFKSRIDRHFFDKQLHK